MKPSSIIINTSRGEIINEHDLELAVKNGISGIIQPGGSVKDQAIIDIVDTLDLIMIFTKERHFYH